MIQLRWQLIGFFGMMFLIVGLGKVGGYLLDNSPLFSQAIIASFGLWLVLSLVFNVLYAAFPRNLNGFTERNGWIKRFETFFATGAFFAWFIIIFCGQIRIFDSHANAIFIAVSICISLFFSSFILFISTKSYKVRREEQIAEWDRRNNIK